MTYLDEFAEDLRRATDRDDDRMPCGSCSGRGYVPGEPADKTSRPCRDCGGEGFPQEPAYGSPEAVAQAAETIRGFTPGPWSEDGATARFNERGLRYHEITASRLATPSVRDSKGGPYTVCTTLDQSEFMSVEEGAANAALIAAAPDLLAERDRLLIDQRIAQEEHEAYRRMTEEVTAKLREQRDALADALEPIIVYVPGQIGDPARAALRLAGRLK